MLDNAALKDLLSTPALKREDVTHLRQAHGVERAAACRVIGYVRMVLPILPAMRVCANGCGDSPSNGGASAIAGSTSIAPRRLRRKPQAAVPHLTADGAQAGRPQDSSWDAGANRRPRCDPMTAGRSTLFSDQSGHGRRFRILAVSDDCTRECLAVVTDTSLTGQRVARELDLLISSPRQAHTVVSYNGTELTSNAILS